jgi:protein-tyrosine phosphatase
MTGVDMPDVFGDAPLVDPRPGDTVAEIVVVCHANVARSPLAMAMLEAAARDRLGPRPDVWVRSAGVHARDGQPAASETQREAGARGLDLGRHRSAVLDRPVVASADLVLTMTESQRAHAARLLPGAVRITFTLPELVRLAGTLDPLDDAVAVRERVRAFVDRAHRARPYSPRSGDPEDVPDPYGGPVAGYVVMARQLEDHVAVLAPHLFGAR